MKKDFEVFDLMFIRFNDYNRLLIEIAKQCNSFSLESNVEFNGFLPKSLISNLINEVAYVKKNGGMVCKRYYKLNSETLNYLFQMNDIYDYSALKVYRPVKGDDPKIELHMSQENLAFYQDGECVLSTLSHEGYCTVYSDEVYSVICNAKRIVLDRINGFMNELSEKMKIMKEYEVTRYFSLSKYDTKFFMFNIKKYYPKKLHFLIKGINKFINSSEVIRQCALIICDRVKENNYNGIDNLYLWLSSENLNHNADDVIEEFLLSCDEKIFVTSYNNLLKNIIVNISYSYDCFWVDSLVELWYKRGVFTENLDDDIAWFLEEYIDTSKANSAYFKKHAICLKYASILSDSFNGKSKQTLLDEIKESDMLSVKIFKAYKYFYGVGGQVNYKKAFDGFFIGASNKVVDCQYDLAKCFLNGWGTEKDIEQAKYWFGKAAENGHPKAREQLDLIAENKV